MGSGCGSSEKESKGELRRGSRNLRDWIGNGDMNLNQINYWKELEEMGLKNHVCIGILLAPFVILAHDTHNTFNI